MSQLVRFYQDAMFEHYGVNSLSINNKWQSKFVMFEQQLMKDGLSPAHYADTVAQLLKNWCVDKGLAKPPPHIFISDFALNKYLKLRSKTTIELTPTDDNTLIRLNLAVSTEMYLFAAYEGALHQGRPVDEGQLVTDFNNSNNQLVTPEWRLMLEEDKRYMVRQKVINIVIESAEMYSTTQAITTYPDLMEVYIHNVKQYQKHINKLRRNKTVWASLTPRKRDTLMSKLSEVVANATNMGAVL